MRSLLKTSCNESESLIDNVWLWLDRNVVKQQVAPSQQQKCITINLRRQQKENKEAETKCG